MAQSYTRVARRAHTICSPMRSETHEAVGQQAAGAPITSFRLPTPKPGQDQVLVRVQWTAAAAVHVWVVDYQMANPKYPYVIGANVVGDVVAVGEEVTDLEPGDKILSFSIADDAYARASQDYALLSKWSVGRLPSNIPPREAATVPDNLVTAYFSLFDKLQLPIPTLPATSPPERATTPILVWGAGGSAGQYAVQLLSLAGYQKVFAIASSHHHEYLRSIGATITFDYKDQDVTENILAAAGGPVSLVFDAIGGEDDSLRPISKFVGEGSKVAFLLPVRKGEQGAVHGIKWTPDEVAFPTGVELIPIGTRLYQANEYLKRELQPRIVPDLLSRGLIKPNRFRELQGATLLENVTTAIDSLRRGEIGGERLVYKVAKD